MFRKIFRSELFWRNFNPISELIIDLLLFQIKFGQKHASYLCKGRWPTRIRRCLCCFLEEIRQNQGSSMGWPSQDCRFQTIVPIWSRLVSKSLFSHCIFYWNCWHFHKKTFRYYIRCASLARHLYMRGNAGVGAFRRVYGGSQDNGFAPSHFRQANGNIIRKVNLYRPVRRILMINKYF